MTHILQWIFQPKICYRKYYTMEKFNKECSCLFVCKYPPPKELAPDVVTIEEFNKTFLRSIKYRIH